MRLCVGSDPVANRHCALFHRREFKLPVSKTPPQFRSTDRALLNLGGSRITKYELQGTSHAFRVILFEILNSKFLIRMLVGPKYKICKRLGNGVFEKCQTQKFALAEGRRGKVSTGRRPRPLSDFGKRLLEKQRVRFTYGLGERQLYSYVKTARVGKRG